MELEQVGEDIWVANGPEVPFLGLMVGTRMTVVRLGEKLWIHSPVAITSGMASELEDLGRIRYVVAPNKYHHIFLSEWQANYPAAELYASPGLKSKRQDISFNGELIQSGKYDGRSIFHIRYSAPAACLMKLCSFIGQVEHLC